MKKNKFFKLKPMLFLAALFLFFCGFIWQQNRHTLYIIGDSTVRNTNGLQRGWGMFVQSYFDSTKLVVSNQAMAGRSTRTFIKEGRWDKVLSTLKSGDFVMMQFGHNEGSVPDTSKAGYRGVLKGIGEETKELVWPDGKPETVHTYGWYLSKLVKDAKAKGAMVFICSMIPRNEWADGKVKRANNDYGKWAQEVAQREGAVFIDLNAITAGKYDKMGPDEVKKLFPGDHTHTNETGAKINAQSVIDGLKELKNDPLKPYML